MATTFTREGRLLVVRVSGHLEPETMLRDVKAAIDDGRLEAGMDRLVVLEKAARVGDITPGVLMRLQGMIREIESKGGRQPAYCIAFAAAEWQHRSIAQLYCAVVRVMSGAKARTQVVSDEAEARHWLERQWDQAC
ncbi:MAG: hypothetical protein AAFQ75_07195 [Pseudomonadota bacterium]